MNKLFLGILCAVLFSGCYGDSDCYDNNQPNVTDYDCQEVDYTPDGILVCTNGYPVNYDKIDLYISEVEDLLGEDLRTGCFAVLIPDDLYVDEQQYFPCGEDRCITAIQDGNTLVTTPDLRGFKGELVRMMLGGE